MARFSKDLRQRNLVDIEKINFIFDQLAELIRRGAADVIATPQFSREHLYLMQRAQARKAAAGLGNWSDQELELLVISLERRTRELVARIEAKGQV